MSHLFLLLLGTIALAVLIGIPSVIWANSYRKKHEREKRALEDKARRKWDKVVTTLLADPDNEKLLLSTLHFIQANPAYREVGYRMALDLIVTTKSASQNKVFALKVGRLHYSSNRPDGNPTIYDEAAIENDIKSRC